MEGASKMNKQEAIEKIEKGKSNFNAWEDLVRNRAFEDALTIVKKIDEPERPVVPQFVADWYEEHKGNFEIHLSGLCINFTCHRERLNDKLANWYEELENKPIETLVMMHKFGYEVEKEKLYTVELPNPNAGGHVVLCKTSDGIVSIAFSGMARWKGGKNFQLTESEIKEDFEWAWQFAKEVEQCNQEH